MNTKEEPLEINPNKIPGELRSTANWVGWKPEERNGDQTKVPYDPTNGRRASTTDPTTWTDFRTVINKPEYGLGFVLTDTPFAGIDLDHCRDPETGEIEDWAKEIVEKLDSYTEISPSGTGLHIILKGKIPGERNRKGDLEMYETGRYFTVTGNHLEGTPKEIRECSKELRELYQSLFDEEPLEEPLDEFNGVGTGLSDEEVLNKAREAKNGDKFKTLWDGDISDYTSHSEADQALCSILAFWTGVNPEQIDRLFRRSGLVRDKWTGRKDYRDRTIAKALKGKTQFYRPNEKSQESSSADGDNTGWGRVNKIFKDGKKKDARYEAAQVLQKEREFAAFSEGDQLLIYKEENGIFDDCGKEYIKSRVQQKLTNELSRHEVREVIAHVVRSNLQPEENFGPNDPSLICLKNGVFDLEDKTLLEHSPEYQFRRQLPAHYDPEARSEVLDDFLHETLYEEDVPLIEEIAGYCLYRNYFIQKAFMFVGDGSNGKGVTLDLITKMLGKENVSGMSLQKLAGNNRFTLNSLYKKFANIAGDLPRGKLGDTGIFKSLTGQDLIETEVKNARRGIKFYNYAKMIFSANKVPKSPDDTDAFHRRWAMIVFPYQFVDDPQGENEKKRDPNLREKLDTKEVRSALFNRAVKGLNRLLENGTFSYDPSISEARRVWERQARPIKAFAQDKLEENDDDWEFKKDVYSAYKRYCKQNDIPEHEIKQQGQFSKELGTYVDWNDYKPQDPDTGRQRSAYKGLKLKIQQEEEDYEMDIPS